MSVNCGIVGLPNVGKSTLFNALTETISAEAANYPFCTIEPNKGIAIVPDERLYKLAELNNTKTIVPAKLEFVDIAGLVKGAHKGEGLGSQFLANIREVDAIIHVLRCFDDDNIIHVENSVDPIRDAEIVNLELMINDLESLEKRIANLQKKAKSNDKEAKEIIHVANLALNALQNNLPARSLNLDEKESKILKNLQLLTSKPVLYVCNVDEESVVSGNSYSKLVSELAKKENAACVIISSKIEQEIATLDDKNEKIEYLTAIGLNETGLAKVIKASYNLLNLETFFTAGVKETRAWTIKKGSKAPVAASAIHTDFERGFICAETISYKDYIELGGEQKAKEAGKMRLEGKDYIVQDGDVILFRFNV